MKNKLESYGAVNKYFLDKRIFRVTVLILFLLLVAAFVDQDYSFENNVYVSCPVDEPLCVNPYYGVEPCPVDWFCDQEYLQGGETWGVPPSYLQEIYLNVTFILIIFAFIINHLIHNMKREGKE